MRFVMALILGGALALSGCDSDEGTGGSGGSGGTAGSTGMAGSGGSGGMNGGEAPVITLVEWAPVGTCTNNEPSDYTVTVTATDADSDPTDLTYDGSVTSCSGAIDDVTSTINCPNANPYNGMVVVSDGDGNSSNTATFTIAVCATSSATP